MKFNNTLFEFFNHNHYNSWKFSYLDFLKNKEHQWDNTYQSNQEQGPKIAEETINKNIKTRSKSSRKQFKKLQAKWIGILFLSHNLGNINKHNYNSIKQLKNLFNDKNILQDYWTASRSINKKKINLNIQKKGKFYFNK